MKRMVAFILVAMTLAVLLGASFSQQGLPGLWWDDRSWTPVVIAEGTMFCTVSDSTHMKCLAIPPGSLLILPVPQEDHD